MEDIIEKIETTIVSSVTKSEGFSSFEGLYKNWGKNDSSQEERRKELLEIQKSNRNAELDILRGILDLENSVEQKDIFHSNSKVYYRPSIYVAGFNKVSPAYNNVLMMSEWMIEKPSDLAENWYITPCPKGTRVLVVANRGRTKCYTKYGHLKFKMHSGLPGGNPRDANSKRDTCCVLDCFYQEKNNTLYVLDFLAWNNQPMTECDTEFRYFWLQSKFAEKPEMGVVSKTNKSRFVLLPKIPCTSDELNKFMMTYPHFDETSLGLDGLLFYHKQAHYVSGETPLVGWLFPYMVQEVLGTEITVHEKYLSQKPVDYVNQIEFIQKFQKNLKNRSRRTSTNSNKMDTADNKNEKNYKENYLHSAFDLQDDKTTTMKSEESTEVVKEQTN